MSDNCNLDCNTCGPEQFQSVHGGKTENITSNRGHGISYSQKVKELVRSMVGCNTREDMTEIYKENDENVYTADFGTFSKCGDEVRVFLKLNKDKTIIEDYTWSCTGCYGSLSSSAYVYQKIIGMKVSDFNIQILSKEIMEELELPEIKKHCASYPLAAIKIALDKINKEVK